jgi:hypothetical protein
MICPVCKTFEAVQEHHLSYEPEIKIPICLKCHNAVHPSHGVGRGRNTPKRKLTDEEQFFLEKKDLYDWNNIPYFVVDGKITKAEVM